MSARKKFKSAAYFANARKRRKAGLQDIGRLEGFNVEALNHSYQFRVNGELDLYPTNRRFHNLSTGERGTYVAANVKDLEAFIRGQITGRTATGTWMTNPNMAGAFRGKICQR